MRIEVLVSKIKSAIITRADFDYNKGSLTLDPDFMEDAGMYEWQRVDVNCKTNGARFNTYLISGVRGSKCVELNGAAARLCQAGDEIHINAYGVIDSDLAIDHEPIFLDKTYD